MIRLRIRPAFGGLREAVLFLCFSLAILASPFFLETLHINRDRLLPLSTTDNADLKFWRQQLYHETSPLDWVFIGPCTVWWHIHPDVIESEVKRATGEDVHVLNLGFNHFSVEVSALLSEELLKHRPVKNIVLSTPRFNDGEHFPHPDAHYWWLHGEDRKLLDGLGIREQFKLYSATVMGSLRHLSALFRPASVSHEPAMTDPWGARIRATDPDHPLAQRELKIPAQQLVFPTLPEEALQNHGSSLSRTQQELFLNLIRRLQVKGVKVWLLSSPLKEDFDHDEIQEVADWPRLLKARKSSPAENSFAAATGSSASSTKLSAPLILGVSPKWIKQVYSEKEIEQFFAGENLTPTASRLWSHWIGQAIGGLSAP
jgi:hypothetical protein